MNRALTLIALALASLSLLRQTPGTLDLRELRLVDGQGRVRARLSARGLDDGPGATFELLDAAGRPAARLLLDDGPEGGGLVGLELFHEGRRSAWLGRSTARDGAGCELRLLGRDGTPRVELNATPSLWLRTTARGATADLPARPGGDLMLGDGTRWAAPNSPMVLRLEGGAAGLSFESGEDPTGLRVKRGDGRYVGLLEGY
jgi:hypothetical protein